MLINTLQNAPFIELYNGQSKLHICVYNAVDCV